MFYEDFRVGQSAALGEATFSREVILAYGRRFDPRIIAQAVEGGAPLVASGLHVAAAGMRRLVDMPSSLRAAMAERGEESFPSLASRQASKACDGRTQCRRATLFPIQWRRCRSARPRSRNGV